MMSTSVRISSAFNKESIVAYCGGSELTNVATLKEDIEESLACINKQLIFIEGLERLHMGYNIKERDGIADTIHLVFSFKTHNNAPEQHSMHIKKDSFKDFREFQSVFENTLKLIVDGSLVVAELNSMIKNIQRESGAAVAIEYKWAIANKVCSIADWDYNRIKVKLNRSAITALINMKNSNSLEGAVRKSNWGLGIKDFVEGFNSMSMNQDICAIMNYSDWVSALTENMLDTKDVLAVIRRNKNSQGTQSLKSVALVSELGRFLAIVKWSVDYTNKIVSSDIMDDKVLDVDNGRFIADSTIFNKVKQKIMVPDSIMSMLFEQDKQKESI